MAVFSIHCTNEPSSLLEKTCCKLSHSTKGRANQNANVEFKLGTVLVDETKIHQMGMSVNTANRPHNIVTMFTVRRLTPYRRRGTTSLLRASRLARRPLPVLVSVAVLIRRLPSGVAKTRTPRK